MPVDIFDEIAEDAPAKDIFDEVAAESATRDIFDEVAAEIPARPAPVSSPFSVPPAAPYSPGRESSELGLYDLRVPKEFQPTPIRTPGILETLTTGLPLRPFSIGQQLESIAKGQDFGGGVKSEGIPALRVPAGIVKGGENVATGAMQFMTSPAGIATLGLSAAPAVVRSLASAGFAADMARHAPDAYQKFEEARLVGDDMGQAEALTEGLGTLAMAGLAGSHSYATAREVILNNRAKPAAPPETSPAATERTAAAIPERETTTPPQQQGAAPTEAPVAPETVATAGPATAGAVRSAIASDRLDWFAKTGKEPTVLTIRPDEVGDLPKLGRLLTDNAATRGLNESETKRVTALEDTETGKVHIVSTYRERSSGTVRLVQPDRAASKRPNVALQRLPERYVPIDSFLLTEPVKNLHESFPDRASYDAAKEQLTEARQAQESLRATAEEMPAVQGETTEPVLPREAISDEGAAGIHDVFGGARDVADVEVRFDTLVKSPSTPASELARRELRQAAEKLMDEDPSLTPLTAALKLKDWLYENTRPEIDRKEFIRRATGLGQPRSEVARAEAATAEAKPTAPVPPVEPPLGGALMVGVDPIATARAVVRLVTAARQNETVDRITRQLGGHSAPITMAAADASGEALIRFASARGTGKLMGRAKAAEVLGDKFKDEAFREKLGAVIVEDQLRATKSKFQKMADREPDPALKAEYQDMADAAGRIGSPFKSNAEFRKALTDPEILAALERHKEIVQPIAEEAHRMLGGKMMEAGETTGTFANLIAILGEEPVQKAFGGGKGDLTRPRKRPSRFFFERKGTAEKYETDYEKIASRMIEGNFDEVAKRELYGQLETDGLAVTLRPGLPAPEIGGKKTQKFEVQRRGTPAGTQTENLWVREDVARELRQALDVDGPVARAGWVRAAAIGNAIQLAGPTDAFFHVANMLSSISRSQGGRNMLVDLGRKLPGVNVADTIARVAASAKRVIQDSPEIRKRIAELSDIGAMRPLREFGPSEGIRRFIPHELGGRFIQLLDVAGRLVREDLFNNLVKRGLVEDTPANRREWINQLGQYNPRLMPQFQRLMRDFGVSPFVVAGRNFNRNAIRSLLLSQGVKASSPTAWAKMKAVDVAGMALTIFGIAAFINYLTTGNPNGRPGTKVGEIDTGKGTLKIDPLQWTGLRRGMRITGIDALTSGSRWNSSDRETKRRAGVDIVNGVLHPWAGPVPKALSIATTGYGSLGFKESKNPEDFGQNLLAAVEQLNPVARSVLKGWEGAEETGMSKPGAAILETGKSLSGALGVKSRRITSAVQQLRGLHEDWALKHPEPKVRQRAATNAQTSFGPSHYQPLDKAIATGDKALIRKAYIALVRAGNSERDIWDRFSPTTASGRERTLFNESEELEAQFFGSLKPEQRRLYGEAMRDWYRRFGLFQDATGIYRRPRD